MLGDIYISALFSDRFNFTYKKSEKFKHKLQLPYVRCTVCIKTVSTQNKLF